MSQWASADLEEGANLFELLEADGLQAASYNSSSDDPMSSPSRLGSSSPVSPYSAASPVDEAMVDLCNAADAPMCAFEDFPPNLLMSDMQSDYFPTTTTMDFDLGSGSAEILSLDALNPLLSASTTPASDIVGVAAAHCLNTSSPSVSIPAKGKPSVDQKPSKSIKKRKPSRKPKKVASPASLTHKKDLNFSREEVLTMTCEQLDRIVENIQQERELTKEEDQEVRKQRRLIKNRESAAASRKRKRGMVEELEQKLAAYKTENDSLKDSLARMSKENEDLRERLAMATGNSAWRLGRGNMPTAKAGLCLMVVLLSFGLVFNQFQVSPGSGDMASALSRYEFPSSMSLGRVAYDYSDAGLSLPNSAPRELASPARRQLLAAGRGYSVIVDEDQEPAVIESMVIEQSRDSTITVDHRYDPNVTYITILDGKQEGRSLDDSFPEDGSPFLIELIIPTESTPMDEDTLGYQSSLEITCKVIETRLSTHVIGRHGELTSSPAAGQASSVVSMI